MTKRLRVVHVGCGSIAAVWLQAARDIADLEIVGLVDVDPAAAENRRAEFAPQARVGTQVAPFLAETQPDVVFNCTVPEAHHAVIGAALRAGAHVLSEKPLAASVAEARDLVNEAQRVRRLFAVTQNYRYRAAPRTVRALLASGVVGHVTTMACDYFDALHFGNFRDRMEHPLLIEMAVHHFDLARFFGADEPTQVDCCEWNPPGSWYRHGANAFATFRFASDLVFSYRGSWCAEGHPTSGNGTWRFCGTKGTLLWDGGESITAEKVTQAGGFRSEHRRETFPVRSAPGRDASHASVLREFVECVRTRRTPETAAADNLKSLAMVHAAIADASSRRGPQRIAPL